ncbi:MAG: hypothetical protein IPL40_06940 [Proteobacteria bacterium]|nr:hypothetical protein [Pseudomonadota bacterium]
MSGIMTTEVRALGRARHGARLGLRGVLALPLLLGSAAPRQAGAEIPSSSGPGPRAQLVIPSVFPNRRSLHLFGQEHRAAKPVLERGGAARFVAQRAAGLVPHLTRLLDAKFGLAMNARPGSRPIAPSSEPSRAYTETIELVNSQGERGGVTLNYKMQSLLVPGAGQPPARRLQLLARWAAVEPRLLGLEGGSLVVLARDFNLAPRAVRIWTSAGGAVGGSETSLADVGSPLGDLRCPLIALELDGTKRPWSPTVLWYDVTAPFEQAEVARPEVADLPLQRRQVDNHVTALTGGAYAPAGDPRELTVVQLAR